jgi:Tat protein secretion system quality control protein TatD with DNase activity
MIASSGMALMSTHPRDYPSVLRLSMDLPRTFASTGVIVVPCFGVHPWFLHELADDDWQLVDASGASARRDADTPSASPASATTAAGVPRWLRELEDRILQNPNAVVGEIGLDGFHFDPVTKDLVSPLDRQEEAFALQLELAGRLGRPACVHCVRSFGALMRALSEARRRGTLPPRLYFHAFGGKAGTVRQLLAICAKQDVFFGFAPIVNLRSPKTAEIVRCVGPHSVLLESDHEDASLVPDSLLEGIDFYAAALNLTQQEVVGLTTRNAARFYGFPHDHAVQNENQNGS